MEEKLAISNSIKRMWASGYSCNKAARAVSALMDVGGMWLLVDLLTVDPKLSKILVNILVIVSNYHSIKQNK